MNEHIFAPLFRAAFQSIVNYEGTDWNTIKEEITKPAKPDNPIMKYQHMKPNQDNQKFLN